LGGALTINFAGFGGGNPRTSYPEKVKPGVAGGSGGHSYQCGGAIGAGHLQPNGLGASGHRDETQRVIGGIVRGSRGAVGRLEQDWQAWDAPVDANARSGKFDQAIAKAEADYKAGGTRPL
jgi:hypothetical protein